MNVLFRENASINEKIFTIFFLFWMGLATYGLWINFDTEIGKDKFVIAISIILSIAMTCPLYLDNHPDNKLSRFPTLQRLSIFLLLTMVSYGVSWCVLALSFPAVYTENFGISTTELVQVTKKYGANGRGCDPEIETTKSNNRYCVPREFFNRIKEKDTVVMYGKVSRFGYKVTSIELK
jgi:hypothetical protein